MKTTGFLITTFILSLTFIHCVIGQTKEMDLTPIKQASAEFDQALKSADMKRVKSFYADEFINLPPNRPIITSKEEAMKNWGFPNVDYIEFKHNGVEFEGSGDIVFQISKNYTINYKTKDVEPTIWGPGKFIRIWKKQADGSWKIYREMWSLNQQEMKKPIPEKETIK